MEKVEDRIKAVPPGNWRDRRDREEREREREKVCRKGKRKERRKKEYTGFGPFVFLFRDLFKCVHLYNFCNIQYTPKKRGDKTNQCPVL